MEFRTCQFCHKDGSIADLVKYGVRHYAHGRCLLDAKLEPRDHNLEGVSRFLDTLAMGPLGHFKPIIDFDGPSGRVGMNVIGMTGRQFMQYMTARAVGKRIVTFVVGTHGAVDMPVVVPPQGLLKPPPDDR